MAPEFGIIIASVAHARGTGAPGSYIDLVILLKDCESVLVKQYPCTSVSPVEKAFSWKRRNGCCGNRMSAPASLRRARPLAPDSVCLGRSQHWLWDPVVESNLGDGPG